MNRFWALTILAVVLIVVSLAVACKKESPGPTPEPTPAPTADVEPTAVMPDNLAVCRVANLPKGTPPICKNVAGEMVTCPVDTSGLKGCE